MNSISSKEQRLLLEFVSSEADLKENIDALVAASDAYDANPCRAARRPCNRLKHQHYQFLNRRDASWFKLLAFLQQRVSCREHHPTRPDPIPGRYSQQPRRYNP